MGLWIVALTVATAVVFGFTNGFHDTANAMATTIATRALPPRAAVGLAAVLNIVGAFISVTVAATIASGIVEQADVTVPIIFAGLVGAILWNVATWFLGIPSSSSHALVGGVVGAVIAGVGTNAVVWSGIASKVVIPAMLAPFVCGLAALLATRIAYRLTRRAREEGASEGFRFSQTRPLLVGYDGSDGAKAALAAAAEVVAPHASVVACYWQPFAASAKRVGLDIRELVQDPTDINHREAELAAALADEGAGLARAAGLDAEGRAVEIDGPIDEAILSHADELDAAAIVLGARSRSTLRSLLLGSIANEVVQRATRPVFLAPSPKLASRRRDQLARENAEA